MKQKPSLQHLFAIRAVLNALSPHPNKDAAHEVGHALIVLEDAAVALRLGLSFGLRLERIQQLNKLTISEIEQEHLAGASRRRGLE